ncbi:MAG TPA: hypothetical protein VJO52_07365, partial [Gemmatimonadaceae bacterium]|nr:hypothetical protein [Gemmatimonadaceae bacterium]
MGLQKERNATLTSVIALCYAPTHDPFSFLALVTRMTKGKLKDRAAARGEVSVVVFETGQMVTTDARARPRSDRLDPAVFAVVRVQWR